MAARLRRVYGRDARGPNKSLEDPDETSGGGTIAVTNHAGPGVLLARREMANVRELNCRRDQLCFCNSASAANTSSLWTAGFTFKNTLVIFPFGSIMKVLRAE